MRLFGKESEEKEPQLSPTSAYQQVATPHDDAKVPIDRASTSDSEGSSAKQKRKQVSGNDGLPDATPPSKSYAFHELYRFASALDKLLLLLGIVMAIANGAMFPLMAIVFGNALQGFSSVPIDQGTVNTAALNFLYIAIGMFVSEYISYVCFNFSAERQMLELRSHSLQHMMYLDISWYDSHDALQLSSRITGDTVKIKGGMGQKLGESFRFGSQFVSGFIIGFIKGWQISLAMAALLPVVGLALGWVVKSLRSKSNWSQKLYAQAGAVAEETFGNIRTVASLNGERRAIDKYEAKTAEVEQENISMHKSVSVVFGMFFGCLWLMYSIGLWYGGSKVSDGEAEPGTVFSAFFAILVGTAAFAQISPNVTAVSQATGAAKELFEILDTPSSIDASKDEGEVPAKCDGAIEAKNLYFTYPSRPDAPILRDYNLRIAAGQTVAFAGQSGGGKSTLIGLLERFYDPTAGQLLLDGRDIKTLNISWLRSQIGLVSQEPVLFATTILENIRAGGQGISREQAMEAAKLANAHKFISALPNGYDTMVGERGVSLSGGQKQRVAIARAVVREPKILVLDEATSALDAESERVVQAALNDLMSKTQMTTLVIAHRLTTIRNADKIVVLSEGHVAETGTHEELLGLEDGIYKMMYTIQQSHASEEREAIADATVEDIDEVDNAHRASVGSDRSVMSASEVENNKFERVEFGLTDIARRCRPELRQFLFGLCATVVVGAAMPLSALLVSGMITTMTQKYGLYMEKGDTSYLDEIYGDVQTYGILYLCGSFIVWASMWLQTYSFKYLEEKLTKRLRDLNFSSLVRQNVGFFDEKEHATGALTADLATNATKVAVLSGDSQARVFQAAFTMLAGLLIAFILGSWQLTLILLALLPFLVYGHAQRMKQLKGSNAESDDLAESGAHASERLSNIRTVVSLGLEKTSSATFHELLLTPMSKGKKEAQINGLALGFSSSIMMAVNALIFWYGGKLVNNGTIDFGQMIRTLMAITMSVQGISGASSYLGDSRTAFKAGSNIMSVVQRKAPIDSSDEGGDRPRSVDGRIEFQDITFRYPTRPDITVLQHYNLTIEPGQTVAFCGPSGGGKSTCVSLIERFYDPVRGQVLLDGKNVKELNLQWLRSQIGLVGQEPTLFIGTIAENIAMGLGREPSQAEIQEAAKMANAHDFINQFPEGYETQVGLKGEQLSGGQKQRIAIARAILKDPDILLLDEATSALDSESEKIVQDALDKVVALKRRTTVIIAHRLSTIRKADKICVVSGGKIAEEGTHAELMALRGQYHELVESSTF